MEFYGQSVRLRKIFYIGIICVSLFFGGEVFALETEEETIVLGNSVLEEKETELFLGEEEEYLEESIEEDSLPLEVETIEEQEDELSEEKREEVLTQTEILTRVSTGLEFQEEVVLLKELQLNITVLEFLERIDLTRLTEYYLVSKIGVTDSQGIFLENEEKIDQSCYLVLLGNDFVFRYQIQLLGDFTQDNIVNEEDVDYGIDSILKKDEENLEGYITVEEVSYIDGVIQQETYEMESPVEEEVTYSFEPLETQDTYVGDTVVASYKLTGLEENYVNTVYGKLAYDEQLFQLENVYLLVDGIVKGRVEGQQFLYLFPIGQTKEITLLFVFQAIGTGEVVISFQELVFLMNGVSIFSPEEKEVVINILEYGIGGNPEESESVPEEEEKEVVVNHSPSYLVVDSTQEKSSHLIQEVVTFNTDNYIEKLEILGHDISFDKEKFYYEITVGHTVKSLDMEVSLSQDSSFYEVVGNEQLKEGLNEVVLMVYAEDGSRRDYVINVNKMSKDEEGLVGEQAIKAKTEIKFEKITPWISVLIVIILIIGILYRLFKEED